MNHDYQDSDDLLEQLDEDSLPDGWEGGAVRHTGGGIWCREFRHPDKGLRIVYSMHQQGVGLEAVTQNDNGHWIFDKHLDSIESPDTDVGKFNTALELMEEINNGTYDT